MESTIIVYHMKAKGTICFDGFMSAALLWRKYKNTATYLQGFYHERLPVTTFIDKDVIFADFSYPAEYMDDIAVVAKSLLVLDHHETAKVLEDRPYATIDMSMCGCLLVWKHMYGQVEPPLAVRYIDDGDRFTLAMPNAREFLSTLALEEKDFEVWANLLTLTPEKVDKYIETGHAILALNNMRADELAEECFPITLCGVTGLATNGSKFYSTAVGHILATKSGTFGAVFSMRPDGNTEVSLRSIGLNVAEIAETFGGGGHIRASAFSLPNLKFISLFDDPARKMVEAHEVDCVFLKLIEDVKLSADRSVEAIEQRLCAAFEKYDNVSDIVVRTYFRNAVDMPTWKAYVAWIATAMGFPIVDNERKWYHKYLPYEVVVSNVIDESEIAELLDRPRRKDGSVDKKVADLLLNTVKPQYEARLCIQKVCEIELMLPDQSIHIQRSFEV